MAAEFHDPRNPEHMLPATFSALPHLPTTAAGKIDRLALTVPVATVSAVEDRIYPQTISEKHLAALWEEVLEVTRVFATDNFFDLGGDSLRATRLIALIERHFDREVPMAALWRAPTLSRMAAMLEDAAAGHILDAVVPLQPSGSRIPFFGFPGADENPYYLSHLARHMGADQPFYVLRDPRPLDSRGVYTVEEEASILIPPIKSIQPCGPYIVGGHCYGGILAYEIAQQLLARGDQVALVVFFEVPAPGYPKVIPHWKKYLRAGSRLIHQPRAVFSEVAAHAAVLRTLARRRVSVLRRRGLIAAGLKNALEPIERSVHPNTAAGLSYRPRPLDCDVIQFIAADEWHSTRVLDDPRLAWKEFVPGRFRHQETPGQADAFFRYPHVAEFARLLTRALDPVNDCQVGNGDIRLLRQRELHRP